MNIMKTNMLLLDNKMIKDNAGNTTVTPAPVPSQDTSKAGMKALSFLGMQNLMANPKLAQEIGVMNDNPAEPKPAGSSNVAFHGLANGAKKATNKFTKYVPAGLMAVSTMLPAALTLSSCGKDINVSQSQYVDFDIKAILAAIDALRAEIKANNDAQTEHQKEVLNALYSALTALTQIQQAIQNQTLTIDEFKTLVLGKMEDGKLQRSAILEAIMVLQNITESEAKNLLNTILTLYEKGDITFQEAMSRIQELLKENNSLLTDIKEMLAKHFDKYDADMAELKAINIDIKNGQQEIRNDLKKYAEIALSTAGDIKNMSVDIKSIRDSINNGVKFDDSQIIELLKRINATQNMSKTEIIAKIDEYLAKQDVMAADLTETNKLLTKLGFVVSNDVINAINNIGDGLKGLDAINANLAELLAAVKSLATAFNLYAKYAATAHDEEMVVLKDIEADIKNLNGKAQNIGNDIKILIEKATEAEKSRVRMEGFLEALLKKADDIEKQLGRIPTVEEFSIMLDSHDSANQKYYGDLIKGSGIDPTQFDNIKDLLIAIKEAMGDWQAKSNGLLADILARINAMDPTAQDYNEKLDKIIELLKNFKCECNCQCDCDHNQAIDEGIIDIIG